MPAGGASAQTEGVTVGVDHDSNAFLRLVGRELRSSVDGPGDGCLQVLDAEVEVLRRALASSLARPDRSGVVLVILEVQSGCGHAFRWTQLGPAVVWRVPRPRALLRGDAPAQEIGVEVHHLSRHR